jgi:hypothetical protein
MKHHWLPREYVPNKSVHEVCDRCGVNYLDLKRKDGWKRFWVMDGGEVSHEPIACAARSE